jgi:D-tyrosyl-tRNA(Tyr) deacylase
MRVVVQKVLEASVKISGQVHASIGPGLLIFAGWEESDTPEDNTWMAQKISRMRLFEDHEGVMNRSIMEVGGHFLVVSQFTLHAATKKGNRPSYFRAAHPRVSKPLYEDFLDQLWNASDLPVKSGEFGADMKVALINDGPVTITMDSKNKE